jgi:hypothetical protein
VTTSKRLMCASVSGSMTRWTTPGWLGEGGREFRQDAGTVPDRTARHGDTGQLVLLEVDEVLELALDRGAAGEQVVVLVVDDPDVELAVRVGQRRRRDDLGPTEG